MANDNPDQLPEITPEMLAAVTGGASGSSDEAVTAMLQSLLGSIKDLAAQQQNGGGNSFMQMLPMMMMMMQANQPRMVAPPPAAAPGPAGPIGPGDGWVRVA